jgi:hypothetical protein
MGNETAPIVTPSVTQNKKVAQAIPKTYSNYLFLWRARKDSNL